MMGENYNVGYTPVEFRMDQLQEDQKVYELTINKVPIVVDAGTIYIASKRARAYLKAIEKRTKDKTKSNRCFWADIIMLNILTTKMLKSVNAYRLEKLLSPMHYNKKESSKRK